MEVEKLKEKHPEIEVRFAPFLLDPSTPPEGKPRKRMTASGEAPSALEQRGEELGITFSRGREWTSSSLLAHEAAEWAGERPESWEFNKRLLKAYFTDLADVGKAETLLALAGEAGLPVDELDRHLQARTYQQQVWDGLKWAQGVGVSAVPTFIFDEQYGVVGAQPFEVLDRVVEEVLRRRAAGETEGEGEG